MRVLVVDDELSILELLKTALSALGDCDVSIASSGASALKLINAQKSPFDCLLLDIQMPQMNGVDLCAELRQHPDYRDTPIIMLTAMSEKRYVDQAFIAGATDYVTKPFDLLELRSRLNTARKLVREHARTADSIAVARQLKQELDTNLQFSLEDPITIEGVKRALGYTEFENYVLQLSRGHRFNSFITAIKVDNAQHLHGDMSSSDFREALHDIANAISKLTKTQDNMVSYRGNGVFLCISHGRGNGLPVTSETQLNQLIATLQARRKNGHRVRAIIGTPVSTRAFTKIGALHALSQATEAVETRSLHAHEVVTFSRRAIRDRVNPDDQALQERRAYESVLHQLLQEDRALGQR